jgi:hypothetical protein
LLPESGLPDATPEPIPPGPSPEERAAEAAFEARRVRRYTQGLFIFVIGLIWTLAVLPSLKQNALMAVIGVVILCAGLFQIYAALSLRKDGQGDADGGDVSDRDDDDDRSDQSAPTDRSDAST